MENKYAKLFEPVKLGNITLKNRFVMAPMSTCDNLGFHMSEPMIRFCEERAKGGAAMIFTECQAVDKIDSMTSLYKTAGTPNQEKEWKHFNERVKKYDVKTCCQLGSGAGRNSVNIPFGKALSSSKLPLFANPKKYTKAMTESQIHDLVKAFGRAAASAKRAGFDAVEIHSHTGYLLDQFISKCWNHRTDKYGGSAQNRARICVEIIEEIRANVGDGFPIIFRVSMDHRVPGERNLEESAEIIRVLDKTSMDAFDVDLGSYDSDSWGVTPEYYGDAAQMPAAQAIRVLTDKPVFNAGSHTPDTALSAVENGVVDIIMVGRALIADPQYVNKIQQGRLDEIRPCLRCNNYCIYHFFSLLPLSCAVNPEAAAEDTFAIPQTNHPQKIAVIGGGPGGMEAACVAAKSGHKVVLYEKSSQLGGQLVAASEPEFKDQLAKLIGYFVNQMKLLGVDVHMNTEITADSHELTQADQIILALGGSPIVPRIPGIDRDNVIEVVAAHTTRRSAVKGDVVILGGGLSGCDFALELAKENKKVTIVEMMDKLAAKCNWTSRSALMAELNRYGVKQLTNSKAVSFTDAGVVIETADGTQKTLPANTIIVALGTRGNQQAAQAIQARYPKAIPIGDCNTVGQVGNAVYSAYEAIWLLEGDHNKKQHILEKREKQKKFRLKISSILMPSH